MVLKLLHLDWFIKIDDDEYMEILREMETTMDKLKVQTVKIVKNIYMYIYYIVVVIYTCTSIYYRGDVTNMLECDVIIRS